MNVNMRITAAAMLALAAAEASAVTQSTVRFGFGAPRVADPISVSETFSQQGGSASGAARASSSSLGVRAETRDNAGTEVEASYFETYTVLAPLLPTSGPYSLVFNGTVSATIQDNDFGFPTAPPRPVGADTFGNVAVGATLFDDLAQLDQAFLDATNSTAPFYTQTVGTQTQRFGVQPGAGGIVSQPVTQQQRIFSRQLLPPTVLASAGTSRTTSVLNRCGTATGASCAVSFLLPPLTGAFAGPSVFELAVGVMLAGAISGDTGFSSLDAFNSLMIESAVLVDDTTDLIVPAFIFDESGRNLTLAAAAPAGGPAVIPLPSSGWMLLAAVSMMAWRRRGAWA